MGDERACAHEDGVVVHRMREERDENGKLSLVRRPSHLWCPACETAIPIAREAARG